MSSLRHQGALRLISDTAALRRRAPSHQGPGRIFRDAAMFAWQTYPLGKVRAFAAGMDKVARRRHMLMYIELKTGYSDNGPAWIGRVRKSRAGRTVYFNGKAFKREGRGAGGNHSDLETGEMYWISAVKKRGLDRHWAGSGKITIEAAAVDEYLRIVGAQVLETHLIVSEKIFPFDSSKFHEIENRKLKAGR